MQPDREKKNNETYKSASRTDDLLHRNGCVGTGKTSYRNKGIDIIHLEVGEPDFDVPSCVAEAAKAAYDRHLTHYTHSLGDPELRREITAFYQREYGVAVDPDCIIVTSGSSPSILLALMLLCNSESEVVLSNPGYACYRNFVLAAQAKPVLCRCPKRKDCNMI